MRRPTQNGVWPLVVVVAISLVGVLSGCQPNPTPTAVLPAPTVFGPEPPPPTSVAAAPTRLPPSPTVAVPTVAPPTAGPEPVSNPAPARQPVRVTVLHVNDVAGEIDPCG